MIVYQLWKNQSYLIIYSKIKQAKPERCPIIFASDLSEMSSILHIFCFWQMGFLDLSVKVFNCYYLWWDTLIVTKKFVCLLLIRILIRSLEEKEVF